MPVDVEHRRLLGAGLDTTTRHRGDPVAGLAGLGEQPDLAADRLDLRRPVQTQHPPQRDRVDPGRALRAGLAQQGAEHALAQHRIQRVEPVRQPTVDGVRGVSSSPVPASAGNASNSPANGARAHPVNTGGAAGISPNRANARSAATRCRIGQHRHHSLHRSSASVCDRRSRNRCRAILLGAHLDLNLGLDRASAVPAAGEHQNPLGRQAPRCRCP